MIVARVMRANAPSPAGKTLSRSRVSRFGPLDHRCLLRPGTLPSAREALRPSPPWRYGPILMTALDRNDLTSMRHAHWNNMPSGGDLFGELHLAQTMAGTAPKGSLVPGLAAGATASAAAAWLSDHYDFSDHPAGSARRARAQFHLGERGDASRTRFRLAHLPAHRNRRTGVAGDLPADRGARAGAFCRAGRHHGADDGRGLSGRAAFGAIALLRACSRAVRRLSAARARRSRFMA